MPRRPRLTAGDLAYHVLNRRVGRLPLFDKPTDYTTFEKILAEAQDSTGIRIAAYCLMPNHWHLLLWPRRDAELSEVLRWITVTHTQRGHAHHKTAGSGPVYQGRFKSFPVQTDGHFLTVARYVERNALRAKLVDRAEDWHWSSLWRRAQGDATLTAWLRDWPVERPRDWVARVNRPHTRRSWSRSVSRCNGAARSGKMPGCGGWSGGLDWSRGYGLAGDRKGPEHKLQIISVVSILAGKTQL